jgi:hypothetical protein
VWCFVPFFRFSLVRYIALTIATVALRVHRAGARPRFVSYGMVVMHRRIVQFIATVFVG